jgi:hypothetical protein
MERALMSESEALLPYNFSDWELGEDASSSVEAAVFDLIEQARDNTLRLNWPDFAALHDAVLNMVREQLAYAFQVHRSGEWRVNVSQGASLEWHSEIDQDGGPTIFFKPTQLTPLLMGKLALYVGHFPILENADLQPISSPGDEDFDWDANWELAFSAAKQWQGAVMSTIRGLKALRVERRVREAEEARKGESLGGDDP